MRSHGLDAEDVHRAFADRVRRRARARRITIEELADEAGLSRSQIWRILAGQSSPTLETIAKISRALGCAPRSLMP